MTNEELRDGLAEAFAERLYGAPMIRLPTKFRADCLGNANIALAYLKQHNDFARRVRDRASQAVAAAALGHNFWTRLNLLVVIGICDEALSDGNQDC